MKNNKKIKQKKFFFSPFLAIFLMAQNRKKKIKIFFVSIFGHHFFFLIKIL